MTLRISLCGIVLIGALSIWAWHWFDLGHERVEQVERLHGRSLEDVVAELGTPARTSEFPMSECAHFGEFRIELYNFYPPTDPLAQKVLIRELIWEHQRYSVAIWFHNVQGEWIALDSCRWQKGVQF